MSYAELYRLCQSRTPPISRNFVRDKTIELTGIDGLSVMKSGLDTAITRGFYLSARNTDNRFVQQHGKHVIVLARGMTKEWERFVCIKEVMHVFDDPLEATDTGGQFEQLLSEFMGAGEMERSLQMTAEIKCFWRALGTYCPEVHRNELAQERDAGRLDDYGNSLQLRLPEPYVPALFGETYDTAIAALTENNA